MIELHLTGADFGALSARLRAADNKIVQRELRKAIRKAGEDAVRDIRTAIEEIPSSGKYNTGVRAALAAGTNISLSTRGRNPSITIKTSPSRLPANKRPLAKALNQTHFRHRVFGRDEWVNQPGKRYFGAVIDEHYTRMRSGVLAAMVKAERDIAAEMKG